LKKSKLSQAKAIELIWANNQSICTDRITFEGVCDKWNATFGEVAGLIVKQTVFWLTEGEQDSHELFVVF
jgi:hypothetical protein